MGKTVPEDVQEENRGFYSLPLMFAFLLMLLALERGVSSL